MFRKFQFQFHSPRWSPLCSESPCINGGLVAHSLFDLVFNQCWKIEVALKIILKDKIKQCVSQKSSLYLCRCLVSTALVTVDLLRPCPEGCPVVRIGNSHVCLLSPSQVPPELSVYLPSCTSNFCHFWWIKCSLPWASHRN